MKDMKTIVKKIGPRITNIRKHLGLRQKELAKELEISASSISDIEAGTLKPRFELIYNIIRKYNVNIEYLLYEKGKMFLDKNNEFEELLELSDELSDEQKDWMKDFIRHFKESPLVRYSMMSHFIAYKYEHELAIKKDIEKNREKTGSK